MTCGWTRSGRWILPSQVSAPLDVFTKIHHDNNHYLNTLYLFLVGSVGNWPGYRIPSILAGIGTVALAGLIGRRRNPASALLAMLVLGFSYVLVLYSSEARGYMGVVFFSLQSFYLLDRYLETKRWPFALMFSLSAVLGLMSHLVFLTVYLAELVWSGYRLMKSRPGPRRIAIAVLSCHAVPSLFIAALYFLDIRFMTIGGGTTSTLLNGYGTALAWGLGTPTAKVAILWTGIAAVAIIAVGLWRLRREKDLHVFFGSVIVIFPILLAVASGSKLLYVRYFIVANVFLLILFSFVLADLYRQGPRGKTLCLLVLFAYLAGNGRHLASLFVHGRGQYCEAARLMAEQSDGSLVTIGGDDDYRIGRVLLFHGAALAPKTGVYHNWGSWQKGDRSGSSVSRSRTKTRCPRLCNWRMKRGTPTNS